MCPHELDCLSNVPESLFGRLVVQVKLKRVNEALNRLDKTLLRTQNQSQVQIRFV
jgi:hypothetical protein